MAVCHHGIIKGRRTRKPKKTLGHFCGLKKWEGKRWQNTTSSEKKCKKKKFTGKGATGKPRRHGFKENSLSKTRTRNRLGTGGDRRERLKRRTG